MDYSKMTLEELVQDQMKDKLLDGEPLDDIMRDYEIYPEKKGV